MTMQCAVCFDQVGCSVHCAVYKCAVWCSDSRCCAMCINWVWCMVYCLVSGCGAVYRIKCGGVGGDCSV